MLIGLIDVDSHNYPNLSLMKLSAYHKGKGDIVEWYNESLHYDIVYMSKIFSDTYSPNLPEPKNADLVVKGGTGYAISVVDGKEVYDKTLDSELPYYIECQYPDYSLYPEYTGYGKPLKQQTAYGFMSRGCPRGCNFCIVGSKEGRCSKRVATVDQFWKGQGNIVLCDPNILACSEWKSILSELRETGARIEFNQGLDARLITQEKAKILASMNLKTPHFAMDSMGVVDSVKTGIKLYVDAVKKNKGLLELEER